jgi:hypothetical protein
MFLLDVLDNLPRLRMSSSLLQMVLWLLRRCQVANVPTLKGFRKMQTSMQSLCEFEPETFTSDLGNVFTINDPCRSIALVHILSLVPAHRTE